MIVSKLGFRPEVGLDHAVVTGAEVVPCGDRRRLERLRERGMVSAEWAVGILAAIAIAGVLVAVVTNGAVKDALLKFILQVIHMFSGMAAK